MRELVLLLLLVFTIGACNKAPKNIDQVIPESELISIENIPEISKEEGLKLLTTNCFACHNPKAESHDSMLAPPLAGIKHNYMKYYSDRNTFISRMSDYINNPTEENAIMKGPIRRFGIMPKSTLDKDQIKLITAYIFDNELEAPNWFPDHFAKEKGQSWKSGK